MEIIGIKKKLNSKVEKALAAAKRSDEEVLFCLVGYSEQTIIALGSRLLVIKSGMMAGASFGSRTSSFSYKDITAIEVNTGLRQAVIEISTPSYQGSENKDYWSGGKNSPFKASNCIPADKKLLIQFKPYLDKLQDFIEAAKNPKSGTGPATITDDLQKLSELKKQGLITEEEFKKAKLKLLG